MTDRVCIIHAGTHKTATTSQQIFLAENDAVLQAARILFPKSGWYGILPGHHELAWELLASSDGPKLAQVINELQSSDAQSAILSSEDFSLLYARPEGLQALRDGIVSAGFTPKVLLYLRGQASYAESMYVERIKQNDIIPIDRYIDAVIEHGRYTPSRSQLTIEFRYTRLVEPFAETFGASNVIVRAYQPVGDDVQAVFKDFMVGLALLDPHFRRTPVELAIAHPHENESLNFLRLMAATFSALNPGGKLPEDPRDFAARYFGEVPVDVVNERFALFGREEYIRILRSVAADNDAVEQRYGVRVPSGREAEIPAPKSAQWTRAACERPAFDRCLDLWLRKRV